MRTRILVSLVIVLGTAAILAKQYGLVLPHFTKYSGIVRLVDETGLTFCTGFVVSPTKVMTAGHCAAIKELSIVDENLKIAVPAKFSYVNVDSMNSQDVAIVTGDFKDFSILPVDFRKDALVGSKVTSIGYPLGGALHSSTGIVVGFVKFFLAAKDINLISGMSGGPLLQDGTVVGINSRVSGINEQYFTPTINLDTFTGL